VGRLGKPLKNKNYPKWGSVVKPNVPLGRKVSKRAIVINKPFGREIDGWLILFMMSLIFSLLYSLNSLIISVLTPVPNSGVIIALILLQILLMGVCLYLFFIRSSALINLFVISGVFDLFVIILLAILYHTPTMLYYNISPMVWRVVWAIYLYRSRRVAAYLGRSLPDNPPSDDSSPQQGDTEI